MGQIIPQQIESHPDLRIAYDREIEAEGDEDETGHGVGSSCQLITTKYTTISNTQSMPTMTMASSVMA
jgi:hypothetical protein